MVHLMQIFSMPIEKGDKKEDGHSGFKTNKLGEGGGNTSEIIYEFNLDKNISYTLF